MKPQPNTDVAVENGVDSRALSEPYMVVCRGKIFKEQKIKKYPKCDEELDKFYDY